MANHHEIFEFGFGFFAFWHVVGADAAEQPAIDSPFRLERVMIETDLETDGKFVQITEQQIKIQTQAGLQQAGQMIFVYNVSMQSLRNEVASYEATYRREAQTIYVTRKLVDLYAEPVKPPSLFKADEEESAVIARDLRAQIVYEQQ